MNDKDLNKLIQDALHNERELPEGLSERLERRIDLLVAEEEVKKSTPVRKRSLYWLSGIAASLLVGLAIFFQVESKPVYPMMADTFSDPHEAAIAAQHALSFLSTQLNKGLDQVADASKEVDKVNEILNKQFEALNMQQ